MQTLKAAKMDRMISKPNMTFDYKLDDIRHNCPLAVGHSALHFLSHFVYPWETSEKNDPKEEPFEKTTQVFPNCHRRSFLVSRLRPQFKVRNGNGEHDECYRNPRRDDAVARKFSYDATYQR